MRVLEKAKRGCFGDFQRSDHAVAQALPPERVGVGRQQWPDAAEAIDQRLGLVLRIPAGNG
jgi:hypothetical protein